MQIDDDYVRKHARPGENWDQARRRVEMEVNERASQLPGCVVCAEHSSSVIEAEYRHERGMCRIYSEPPEAAFDSRKFDEALAEHESRNADLAAIARVNFEMLMHDAGIQGYPVNVLRVLSQAEGYLKACKDLNLFDQAELNDMRERVFLAECTPRKQFIEQVANPSILPWR
ncbi:hypothetical protein QAO71_17135 (plasmid) [Halopseudomonas sp. SMJS2]|uniref:hypothetical protein n=1 Tax=Halopseudomonas sp. SMJS2 TaxID=3041098 RepID=UPI002452C6A5|nr:hypothetical protein [Halopseudomonas sp. SMJS2]WGK63493.1 hypothetical protein QAO71_17135 [Halopseudomonas sp. SMJS2]